MTSMEDNTAVAVSPPEQTFSGSLAALEALIKRHAAAYAEDDALWGVIPEVVGAPICRVRVSWLIRGRDDNGQDIRDPIYVYSDKEIDDHVQRDIGFRLDWCHNEQAKEKVRIAGEERRQRLKAELAALTAERHRIQHEQGYTAALTAASASAEIVKSIEHEILAFVPGSLAVAVRLASWTLSVTQEDGALYLGSYVDADEAPIQVLRQIVRAAE